MFENPRRGRQARNFTTNVLKILDLKSSSEHIFLENWRWVPLITGTLSLKNVLLFLNGFGIWVSVPKKLSSIRTAWAICLEKIVVRLNSFERLSVPKKKLMSSVWTAWAVRLEKIVIDLFERLGVSVSKIVIRLNSLGYPFQKIVIRSDGRAIHLKKKLSTVGGTEPICSKINFSQISIPKPFHL